MYFKTNQTMQVTTRPLAFAIAPIAGFCEGTEIATPYAWSRVETLEVGDLVLTAEHGAQEIIGIETGALFVSSQRSHAIQWPVHVPEGALGNDSALVMSPAMRVVMEGETAALLFGHDCVSVQANDLIGFRGIHRARVAGPMQQTTLLFEQPQTVTAQGGVFFDIADMNGMHNFLPLSDRQARLLIRQMGEEDREFRASPTDNVLHS